MFIIFGRLLINILLALFITSTWIGSDYLFRILHHLPILNLGLMPFLNLFALSMALTLLKKSRYSLLIYAIITFLICIQWIHYNYFGSFILPVEISLFFTHSAEATANVVDLYKIALPPLLGCLGVFLITGLGFYLAKKRLRYRYYGALLLILTLLLPLKTIIPAIQAHRIEKDPHYSIGDRPNTNENMWASTQKLLLFYGLYTLPHELWFPNPIPPFLKKPLPIAQSHPNINIIYIQGESLTSRHMSLYGYSRETTPYLDSIKNNPHLIFKQGISLGVSTDVSLPEFFNMIERPDGTQQITTTHNNLFKMAKMNGFKTHFISVQYDKWLGIVATYLYPGYIDHFKVLGKNIHYKPDDVLAQYIQDANLNNNNFLVVQMGGSHLPYQFRYPKKFKVFKSSSSASFKQQEINYYDNSVLHTDNVIKKIISIVQNKSTKPTYIIFTSDHGESLGDHHHFGHNNLSISSEHEVPIIIMGLNGASLDFIHTLEQQDINPNYMSHYELSNIVAYLLGYKIKQFSSQRDGYFVTGPILNGFGGFDEITFNANGQLQDHFYTP